MPDTPLPLLLHALREAREALQVEYGDGYAETPVGKAINAALSDAPDEGARRSAWWEEGEALGLYPVMTIDVDAEKERLIDSDSDSDLAAATEEQIVEAAARTADYDWSNEYGDVIDSFETALRGVMEESGVADACANEETEEHDG